MTCYSKPRSNFRAIRRSVLVGVAGLLLARCASYSSAPLEQRTDLLPNVATLTVPASDMPLPELASHTFDPSRPLDMDEIAMVAVVNNSDLKAMRNQMRVAGRTRTLPRRSDDTSMRSRNRRLISNSRKFGANEAIAGKHQTALAASFRCDRNPQIGCAA
jgi:hypothetical protein